MSSETNKQLEFFNQKVNVELTAQELFFIQALVGGVSEPSALKALKEIYLPNTLKIEDSAVHTVREKIKEGLINNHKTGVTNQKLYTKINENLSKLDFSPFKSQKFYCAVAQDHHGTVYSAVFKSKENLTEHYEYINHKIIKIVDIEI